MLRVCSCLVLFILLCAAQRPTVRLGRTVSLAGVYAAESTGTLNGLHFWKEYVNNGSGLLINGVAHNVELVTWNDASDLALVELLYDVLATRDKVVAAFGPWTAQMTAPAIAQTNKSRLPFVFSGSSNPAAYNSGYTHSFGLLVAHPKRHLACMDIFRTIPDIRTAATISSDDAFQLSSRSVLVSQATQRNITVLYNATVSKSEINPLAFDGVVSDIDKFRPDLLLLSMEVVSGAPFLTQLRKRLTSYDPKAIYITSGFSARLIYEQTQGWQVDGAFAGNQWVDFLEYNDPFFNDTRGFALEYHRRFNYTPSFTDAAAVIAGFVMGDALQRAASLNAEDIIAALRATNMPETFFGPIQFLPSGEVNLTCICQQLQGPSVLRNEGSSGNATVVQPVVRPEALAQAPVLYPATPKRPPKPKLSKSDKRGLIIGVTVGGFLLIALVVLVVVFVTKHKYHLIFIPKHEEENDEWGT